MGMSRLENISSISSVIDSMVDWLDILLLPNTDLQNNVRAHFYKVTMCGNTCPDGLHKLQKGGSQTVLLYVYKDKMISLINKSYMQLYTGGFTDSLMIYI